MRIVGGALRGRRLKTRRSERTRPSSERLREGLSAALEARGLIADAETLDLFAGSGALGLEALSRGARRVTAVDADAGALRCLEDNARALQITAQLRTLRADLWRASDRARLTARLDAAIDLVLCDPPYADAERASDLFEQLVDRNVLAAACHVALEHSARTEPIPGASFEWVAAYRYGSSALSLWRRKQVVATP